MFKYGKKDNRIKGFVALRHIIHSICGLKLRRNTENPAFILCELHQSFNKLDSNNRCALLSKSYR